MNRVLSVNWISRFQLTHSRGVRLGAMAIDILALGISTHALTWSATIPGYSPARFLYISTHALTWSATEENLITLLIIKISTHALTWSATISSTVIIIPHFISTHALTWSATLNIVLKKDSPHSIWEFIAFYHQLS